jgi:hypothetical protein
MQRGTQTMPHVNEAVDVKLFIWRSDHERNEQNRKADHNGFTD